MAEGFSTTALNSALDSHVGTYDYIQLHTAAPGAAGTTAIAGNATRKLVSWGTASGGSVSSNADIDWSDTEVDTSEDYTHYTLWTAATAGTFGSSGTITANAVSATGDSFSILSGDLTISGTAAS